LSSQNLQVDDLDYVTQVILKEAKEEDRLTNQLLITMLSAYSKNPINLLINERSGVGKNYVINKVAAAFPKSDILMLASMTEKVLFHRPGILVIQNKETGEYESIESQLYDIQEEILEKEKEISLADKYSKADLKNEIKQIEKKRNDLLKESKKLIDLSNNPTITEIPEILNNLPSLETIKLWNCNIKKYSESTEKIFWMNQNYRFFTGYNEEDKIFYQNSYSRVASSDNKLYKKFVEWVIKMRQLMEEQKFSYQDIYRFNEETIKKAIWSGRVTNDFKKWLDSKRYQRKITSFF